MLALLILLAAPQAADPLAPALEGKLQCYAPNAARMTCQSLASYSRQPDGSWLNVARVLIAADLRMEATTLVHVKGMAVCGLVSRDDLLAAHLATDEGALSADEAGPVIGQVIAAYDSMGALGKEICTTYLPDGDGLRAEVAVAGTARPELTQKVIWVGANDGYTLGMP